MASVAVLAATLTIGAAPAQAATPQTKAAQPVTYPKCDVSSGTDLPGTPWAQTRLRFDRAWSITTGAGVRVAVIDTGVNPTISVSQMRGIRYADPHTVLPDLNPKTAPDCDGHGTGVAGIIAAQPDPDVSPFEGVAPGVTIIPIRQTYKQNDETGGVDGLVTAIRYAVDKKAQIINLSLVANAPSDALRAAVQYAARHDVLIVAAAGNDTQNDNRPGWPAAYSTSLPNVIAVGSVDRVDQVSAFSVTGPYLDVVAPGEGVDYPAAANNWQINKNGTSFATPFVTGTAALVRAAHPTMTAEQVRARIEATADPPPADVPSTAYGWGVVDPYLAVTAVRRDDVASPAAPTPTAVPMQQPPAPQDRHLQHAALGFGLGLIALAVLTGAGSALARRRRGAVEAGR